MPKTANRERRADSAATIVFTVFVVAGVGSILATKLIELNPFFVTSVPCLLMVAYAALIVSAKRLRLRNDQTADNFYYMGFIFTLVSLAVSLYQYGQGGSIERIISNFGVAIASTIFGIALRIIFNQMRRDPVEVEHYSRLDLAEASNRVRRELDGVVLEMTHFRRSNQQMLAEGFQEIRDEVARTAKEGIASSTALAADALKAAKTANDAVSSELKDLDLKSELDQTTKNLKRVSTSLAKASDQVDKAAASFTEGLAAFSPPNAGELQTAFEGLRDTLVSLGDRMEAQTAIIQSMRTGMEQTASIERNIAQILANEDLSPGLARGGLLGMFRRRSSTAETRPDEKSTSANR
jgi:hypothetical protein